MVIYLQFQSMKYEISGIKYQIQNISSAIYKYYLFRMLKTTVLALAILSACLAEISKIQITNYMVQPQVFYQKIPIKTANKYVYENYVQSIKNVDFETSAYLFMREGALSGDDAYDLSNYKGFSSECRIYKTDLKLRQYKDFQYTLKPDSMMIIENNNTKKDGRIASIYVAHENKHVNIFHVTVPQQYKQMDFTVQQAQFFGFGLQISGNFSVQAQPNEKIHLFNIDDAAFAVTNNILVKYNESTGDKIKITGYNGPNLVFKAQSMDENIRSNNKRFYTQTNKKINIYEFKQQNQVELVKTIDQFGDINILASIYDEGFFYVTAFNKLFVIDYSDTVNVRVSESALNGTCTFIEKFKTTMHISCEYEKLNYIVEFFALANTVTINRYYASEDIQGRAITRRLGFSKMAIVSDEDIRILSYGINRKVLIQEDITPPEYVFTLKYGIDLIPIKKATSQFLMTFITFTAQKLALLQVKQTPPQLYCQFPIDKIDAQYQILMQFNASKCSYVKRQEDLFYGTLQNVCEISVPVLIQTKQVQLQAKHTNFIQIIMALLIVGVILLIVACAIKCNKNMRLRFEKAEKALQKARKGFKVDPNSINSI